ncbi:WXG100 family type VII secretion target [Isobaculum melis]|uniref:WXG100 family type VII secretion target n=1 Tax=Isobaculum melis TaxID=142588 RepID=A0A1H9PWX2_9LACT|nr:hypothetical protein [Isobaculum melis]SER52660.1 hypothetical protein SAMN04488559_101198 [Isobaculum melis]
MGHFKVESEGLSKMIRASLRVDAAVEDALKKCDLLKSEVASAQWQGEAKEVFASYLDIIQQYHQGLKKATALQEKALQTLLSDCMKYHQFYEVEAVRKLV